MNRHRCLLLLGALLLAVTAAAAAAAPAAGAGPDPATAATAYLQARGAAVAAADPAAVLAPWLTAGSQLAAQEALVARGAARRAARLGHIVDGVDTAVTVMSAAADPDGVTATVTAHVVTTTRWHAASGAVSTEASGIDHTVSLRLGGGGWRIVADTYADVQVPAYLESAGAPVRRVRAAAARLERAAPAVPLRAAPASAGPVLVKTRPAASRYVDILYYDREACRDYADKYALSYNPTFVRFSGADCANFGSQSGCAGGMPLAFGTVSSGWWYDKQGTSSAADDAYSLSWINVPRQMGYWNTRRTDWASSISDVGKGDFVYYDCSRLRVAQPGHSCSCALRLGVRKICVRSRRAPGRECMRHLFLWRAPAGIQRARRRCCHANASKAAASRRPRPAGRRPRRVVSERFVHAAGSRNCTGRRQAPSRPAGFGRQARPAAQPIEADGTAS